MERDKIIRNIVSGVVEKPMKVMGLYAAGGGFQTSGVILLVKGDLAIGTILSIIGASISGYSITDAYIRGAERNESNNDRL